MIISRILFVIFILSFFHGLAFGSGKRTDYVVGRDRIEKIFTEYISERFNISEKDIRPGNFRYHPVHLKTRPADIHVEERRGGGRGKKLLLRVTFVLKNRRTRNSFISLPFRIYKDAVVSKKALKRGYVLKENDISVKKIWVDYGDTSGLSPDYFAGKKLLKSLDTGEPLKKRYVASLPIVKRGDRVTVLFEKNGIRINTTGFARGDASRGDMVKVLSSFSKKILAARVLARDLVSVEF